MGLRGVGHPPEYPDLENYFCLTESQLVRLLLAKKNYDSCLANQ
jgi:hypothetical protein